MPEPTTYSPNVVCSALGIPAGTLAAWASRGRLANLDAARTTQGKARRFTLRDVLALALLKAASDGGVEAPELFAFIPTAAQTFLLTPGKVREVNLYRYSGADGAVALRYSDEVMREPVSPGWVSRVTFNVGSIFTQAQLALAEFDIRNPLLARALERMDAIVAIFDPTEHTPE